MRYFILPTCCIAFNAKVASSSLACSIVKKYYPDRLQKVLDDHEAIWSRFSQGFKDSLPDSFQKMFKNDKLDSVSFWQNVCPTTQFPDKPVMIAFRDPVERFASTVAYLEVEPEKALKTLEDDGKIVLEKTLIRLSTNTHFLAQCSLIRVGARIYRFPDQIQKMCSEAGLDFPLEYVNQGKNPKPELSQSQIGRLKKIYAADFAIWESLSSAK